LHRALERQILAIALAASLSTLLLVAGSGLAPVQRPLTVGLVFWKWFGLLYGSVGIAVFIAAVLAGRLLGRPALATWAVAAQALAFLIPAIGANAAGWARLTSLQGPARFRWLCPAGCALSALGLLAIALLPRARQREVRALSLLALALAAPALIPRLGVEASAGAAVPPRARGERLLVVGVDGADWRWMEPLLARGDLPRFAALREQGAWGRLRTIEPTLSPVVWTTMVTGKGPAEHGISGFLAARLEGVNGPLPELVPVRYLGFGLLDAGLRRSERIVLAPVTSAARRVPAFWNIASRAGSPVSVLNWWATWPAEAVVGHVISERAFYQAVESRGAPGGDETTFPDRLYDDVARTVLSPEDVGIETARGYMDVSPEEWQPAALADYTGQKGIVRQFPYFYSHFESTRRLALLLAERGRVDFPSAPPDLFVLFRFVDMACHASLAESELTGGGTASPGHARVVSEAYRAMDRALGQLVDAFGAGNVIIVSDHGFDIETRRGARRANHGNAPDGIFLAAGSAFRHGEVEGMSVYDVVPLLLHLKGFSVARDLPGRVPRAALSPALAARASGEIASYGTRDASGSFASGDARVDEEMVERLKALGYVE
jgi:hypothetical protein